MIIPFQKDALALFPYPHCAAVAACAVSATGMGNRPCGRRCCPRVAPHEQAVPSCVGAAPAGATAWPWAVAPCGLVVGAAYARKRRPCSGSLARGRLRMVAAAPTRGFGRGWPPPCKGPWPQSAVPCSRPGRGWSTLRTSYIPVFQIRMEKMKDVKHPPL
ncbi:hypothetical protein BHE74_00058439 [Ensete ventricosum]|nr:hypothetical protein BHE74_00058439 [Ensete ventricosum]